MKSISVLNKLFRSSFKNNSNNKPNKNPQLSKHIIVAPGQSLLLSPTALLSRQRALPQLHKRCQMQDTCRAQPHVCAPSRLGCVHLGTVTSTGTDLMQARWRVSAQSDSLRHNADFMRIESSLLTISNLVFLHYPSFS